MSAARRRAAKSKKPLGRKAALEALALKLGAGIMRRQKERAASLNALYVEADAEPQTPKYVSPALEAKRRLA